MKFPIWKCVVCGNRWGKYDNIDLGYKWCPDCIAWQDNYDVAKSMALLIKKGLINNNNK